MAVILVGLLLISSTPLFAAADSPPIATASRVSTLDGLRGFLALSVLFHHAALYHTYMADGRWLPPPDRLYAMLGPFGVSIFFMITGFLFWSQIIDKNGKPDWIRLYVGRVFRIGPIYWVAIGAMIISVCVLTGMHLHESLSAVAKEVFGWVWMGFVSGRPINGFVRTGDLIANVTWSLKYEWLFYGSLIATSFFARHRVTAWLFPAAGLVGSLIFLTWLDLSGRQSWNGPFVALFFVGMLTGSLRDRVAAINFGRIPYSAVAAALLVTVLAFFSTPYAPIPLCLLAGAFFLIANGATLFGLLTTVPARRLGDISFGIYLLQGLVLSAVFATRQARDIALSSPLGHWTLVSGAALALIIIATAAHALIERPGVEAGRQFLAWLRLTWSRSFRLRFQTKP